MSTVKSSAPITRAVLAAAVTAAIAACAGSSAATPQARSSRYDDLVALFADWRAFQKPHLTNGVPDYTAAAMTAQQRELPAYQRRLAAIDPGECPVAHHVDWHIVRPALNGLDFDHRVLTPWAAKPASYVPACPAG